MRAEKRSRPSPRRAAHNTDETAVNVAKINELRYSHAFHNNDADLVTHERKVLQTVAYQEQSQPSVRPARRSGHRVRAAALAVVAFLVAAPVLAGTILGTTHDFLGLNARVGVVAMGGVAFSKYDTSCVYCHLPPERPEADSSAQGGNPGWNRYVPPGGAYDLYDTRTLDNKVRTPSPISLLCLSCHDGTMGGDMTVFKPAGWQSSKDAALHLRLNGGDDLMSCGKCHNGRVAHSIAIKHIGTALTNDHAISKTYAGLTSNDPDFRTPDTPYGNDNSNKRTDV